MKGKEGKAQMKDFFWECTEYSTTRDTARSSDQTGGYKPSEQDVKKNNMRRVKHLQHSPARSSVEGS